MAFNDERPRLRNSNSLGFKNQKDASNTASISDQITWQTYSSNRPNNEQDLSAVPSYLPARPDLERHISLLPMDPVIDDEITYPEGGREAWLVVFGAWCSWAASLGVINSTGVFQAFISQEILKHDSTSTIGWIFGVYFFMAYFCQVQSGPTFDAKGPRGLLIAGSICTLASVFALSACKGIYFTTKDDIRLTYLKLELPTEWYTEYYQFVLAFSILGGLGASLLIAPGMGSVAHWFFKRRGLASGIAFTGSGVGGVVFPLMMQALLPRIGWAWSIRALGLILTVLCFASVTFCRSRVPPRNGTLTTWRDTLPDPRIFADGTGAMLATTAAVVLVDIAYLIPMTYVPSYYLARQNLSPSQILSGEAAFAYQLLAVVNASSCVGRYVAGDLADRFGRYNVMIVSLAFCVVSVACFFLPDVLLSDLTSLALLIVFAILFGFVSGSNVSLTPICLGQLCDVQDYGRYYASCYTVVSFGCLMGTPIAGALINAIKANGKEKYWAAFAFGGLCYFISLLCLVWVRVRVKGWDWSIKW
ncbi:MAG: hypothetical protein M1822_009312 [Bathelium mastoideum]|nr:MAG: hypothetical protein M1822_009312 [Bathelium mastoideum]